MRLLFSGDWQFNESSLHKSALMLEELHDILTDKKVDALINLGDVKERYNPVDVRITNFAIKQFSKLVKRRIPVEVVLGNHDRVGMWTDEHNWLPVLKSVGARVWDKPGVVEYGDDASVYMLPFCSSVEKFKASSKYLARLRKDVDNNGWSPGILAFHQDILGCLYNVLSKSEDNGIKPKYLYPELYMFCIGGHIHLQQNVKDNIWFAGSATAHDWGECNQRKGHLLVDTEARTITPIWSQLPRLHDDSWPRFEETKPKSWNKAIVRIHVKCDSKVSNIPAFLDKAAADAEKKYPGATIVPIPEINEGKKSKTTLDPNTSDEKLIRAYVEKMAPENLQHKHEAIVRYMMYHLSATPSTVLEKPIEFLGAYGENFLSFKEIKQSFRRRGIVTISGKNGSGKSSYLSPLPVALFGQTFKGQQSDKWARRGCSKKALIEASFKVNDNKYTIRRTRHPQSVQILDDNKKDVSVGNKRSDYKTEIERITAYNFESFACSIFIDQEQVYSLLQGGPAARQALLGRFLGLERYVKALELVKEDIKNSREFIAESELTVELLSDRIRNARQELDGRARNAENSKSLKKRIRKLQKTLASYKKHKKSFDITVDHTLQKRIRKASITKGKLRESLEAQKAVKRESTCPTCGTVLSKMSHSHFRTVQKKTLILQADYERAKDKLEKLEISASEYADAKEAVQNIELKMLAIEGEIDTLQERLTSIERREQEAKDLASKIKQHKQEKEILKDAIKGTEAELQIMLFVSESFSRNGMPAYLAEHAMPRLNRDAKFYSKLFTDEDIKIRFSMDEDQVFKVEVINPRGGEAFIDQSVGEKRLIALITGFALRDLGPKSNLLICDEPGYGLDDANAQRFARGLRELSKYIDSIFVTSHNPVILSELSGHNRIRIVKKGAVSRIKAA